MTAHSEPNEIAALRSAHPDVRFIDVLLADLCGIPRGKRVTLA